MSFNIERNVYRVFVEYRELIDQIHHHHRCIIRPILIFVRRIYKDSRLANYRKIERSHLAANIKREWAKGRGMPDGGERDKEGERERRNVLHKNSVSSCDRQVRFLRFATKDWRNCSRDILKFYQTACDRKANTAVLSRRLSRRAAIAAGSKHRFGIPFFISPFLYGIRGRPHYIPTFPFLYQSYYWLNINWQITDFCRCHSPNTIFAQLLIEDIK